MFSPHNGQTARQTAIARRNQTALITLVNGVSMGNALLNARSRSLLLLLPER